MAQEAVAGVGFEAEDDSDQEDAAPRDGAGQARIARQGGQGAVGRLIGGEPPREYGSKAGRQNEGENLAADPAFHLSYGLRFAQAAEFSPHEKFPKQESGGKGHPAVERAFTVCPKPATEEKDGRVRCGQLGQDVEADDGIANYGEEQHGQTE